MCMTKKKQRKTVKKRKSLKEIKSRYNELLERGEKSLEKAGLTEEQSILVGTMLRDAYILGKVDEVEIHRKKLRKLVI